MSTPKHNAGSHVNAVPARVEPRGAGKQAWQAPRVTRTDLSETANNTGTGPDGGTFS